MIDLIIIGGGPAGYNLALKAQKFALNPLLIEKAVIGGVCLNCGCIPTKALYKNASLIKEMKAFNTQGIKNNYEVDYNLIIERKNKIVEELNKGIIFNLEKQNIKTIYGTASIIDKNTVIVNNIAYQAKNIVIASGSRPSHLNVEGIDLKSVISSEEALQLKEVPKKMVIIGGGVIGIEMASIFNEFGTNIEIIEMLDTILPTIDKEISKRLLSYFKRSNIKVHLSSKVRKITENSVIFEEKGEEHEIECDKVLVSIGRKANIEELNLEEIGVKTNNKGIIVDENFETSVKGIYAIGDVTGKMMLAHYATFSGYRVLNHILGKKDNINFNLVPSCVFTFPEVAALGEREEDLIRNNQDYQVNKALFRANGKANCDLSVEGFVKIIHQNDEIKGVFIIGPHASELIHEAVIIMNKNIKISMLKDYIFAHPTLSETFYDCIIE